MFIETHVDTIAGKNIPLTFIKSKNVQAFPCGRRRSAKIDQDDNTNTTTDQYRIPFDPEARLNTEANNRKHSGLNGFTQTYLSVWDKIGGQLSLSLAGYLFNIILPDETDGGGNVVKSYREENTFGTAIADLIAANTSIYANILIEETQLFSGRPRNYNTEILRNQSNDEDPALDFLKSASSNLDPTDADNYYFSGLSFSADPLTGNTEKTWSTLTLPESQQVVVSLHILEKLEDTWVIYEPARLPKIEHGDTEDSVVLGDTTAASLTTPTLAVSNETGTAEANIDVLKATDAKVGKFEATKTDTAGTTVATVTIDGNDGSIDAEKVTVKNIDATTEVKAKKLLQNGKSVPFIALIQDNNQYQLQITLDPSI